MENYTKFDSFANAYYDDKDQNNCVVLINGRRFKLKSNVVVFESEKKALAALRNAAWRWFRWHNRIADFDEWFDKWIEERVVFVPPEDYYRFKRKMRNGS